MEIKFALATDAARVVQCSPSLIVQLADRGELPVAGRTPKGVRIFLLQEVEQFAATRNRTQVGGVNE